MKNSPAVRCAIGHPRATYHNAEPLSDSKESGAIKLTELNAAPKPCPMLNASQGGKSKGEWLQGKESNLRGAFAQEIYSLPPPHYGTTLHRWKVAVAAGLEPAGFSVKGRWL